MRKALTAAMAAITLGGAVCAAAAPAQAQRYSHSHYSNGYYNGGHSYGHSHYNNNGVAVAAGVAGLALGAALASNHGYYGGGGYYAQPAYGYGYGYDYAPAYRTCETTRWVWDPYVGRRVPVREAYAC